MTIFRIPDYNKIPVILSHDNWHDKLLDPILGHPEIESFLIQIKATISNPDYIYQSIRDPRSKLFFTKILEGKFAFYFLAVVVKYLKEKNKTIGYVSTIMINRRLPKSSKLLWAKKVLI